ncbi:hypothetical protein CP956_14725 [Klebsiella pneumoniae]|nr:hypothetical protein [Klebsiella pneumoniae]RJP40716.1 hypothetical protein CP956_14725 [Klebsiella pneumoniae]
MKGMTVIVLMWEEAAIKDDVIEYDIAFNIIYIMRTHVVVAKLRYPPLTNRPCPRYSLTTATTAFKDSFPIKGF